MKGVLKQFQLRYVFQSTEEPYFEVSLTLLRVPFSYTDIPLGRVLRKPK